MSLIRRLYAGAALTACLTGPAGPVDAGEKLAGYAEYRKDVYLIVDGQRVRVNEKTRYRGDASNFGAISLGHEVKVKGTRLDDGAVLARKLEARPNEELPREAELKRAFDEMEALYRRQGRMVHKDGRGRVVQDYGELLDSGPRVDRVRRISTRLVPPYLAPGDFRVYVVDNPEWNAMAAPNFSIYVFSGLLADMNDDEVALVVGHELAHATHEHSRRQQKRGLWVGVGVLATAVLADAAIEDDTARITTQIGALGAALALTSGYSREHEDQADRVGMRYAYEGGYDVRHGPALWERFAEKYGDSPVAVNFFFGEHSRSTKRARLLEEEIRLNYTRPAVQARGKLAPTSPGTGR